MPEDQEKALRRVAAKYASKGKLKRRKGEPLHKAKDRFVYGTMKRRARKGGKDSK